MWQNFIVIETFGGAEHAAIVTNEDGMNKVFTNKQYAQQEASECQEGIVIDLEAKRNAPLPLRPNPIAEIKLRGLKSAHYPFLEVFISIPNSGGNYVATLFPVNSEPFDLDETFKTNSVNNSLNRLKEVLTALNVDLSNFDSLLPKELK